MSIIKKKILGKKLKDLGIDELLSDITSENHTKLKKLPIDIMQPGKYQPRTKIDDASLEELISSIKAQGIIQPIIVRPISDANYEIIAGERRWRAASIAGIHEIPVIIKPMPDKTAIAVSLIENIQRENLNSIEEACALKRLINEFDMNHQKVAEAVGKSRTTITNLLRLLNLPQEIKNLIENKKLSTGHARTLLTLDDSLKIKVAEMIIQKDLSVRATELLVKRLQNPKKANPTPHTNNSALTSKLKMKRKDNISQSEKLEKGLEELGVLASKNEIERLIEHIKLLQKWNKTYNLTSINDFEEMIIRHTLDSLSVEKYISGQNILDVGTGAGFPGFPLATLLTKSHFSLLDSNIKKIRFLTFASITLKIKNVDIIYSRVEKFQAQKKFDTIVSRATFSSIGDMISKISHLCHSDTKLIIMKSTYLAEEVQKVCKKFSAHKIEVPFLNRERNLLCIKFGDILE